jgi:branched-chain amino acid transport system substrate-binding protein
LEKRTNVVLAALLAFAAPSSAQSPGVSNATILLGQSAPLSGPAEQLGIQMRNGIKLYLDHVNAQGGVNGRRIDLKTRDDKNDSAAAAANTKALIQEDKVFALIGYVGSAPVSAALPLLSAAKVPIVGPAAGDETLHAPLNRLVFNIRASYAEETDRIVEHLVTTGNNKIAVFYQDDSFGQAGLAGASEAMTRRGSFILSAGSVERNSLNVAAAVRSIVATKPDTVLMFGSYKPVAAFVRDARKAGFLGGFYALSSVGSKALADELGTEAAGVAVSQVVPFPWADSLTAVSEFRKLAKAGDTEVNFSTLEGFIAAKVMVEGLKRAGKSPTREGFVAALEGKTIDLGGYRVDFSPTNRTGSKLVELTLIGRGGRFVK